MDIIKIFDSKLLISIADKFCLNKQRIKREIAFKEILEEIEEYYKLHKFKRVIVAEEVKFLQKNYWKSRNNPKYRKYLKQLESIKDTLEIIKFLSGYYLNDIMPDFNPAFLIFFREVCKLKYREFVKNFKVLTESDNTLKSIKNIQGKYPLFFLPNHISNADHIPICFALNKNGIFHPVIVAGANLYRGISKRILPKLNVEKLRRDYIRENFKWLQNPLYRMCFERFNRYIWRKNEPFLFYIEGGRSRDGKIRKPKYGIISEIFKFLKEEKRICYFVPVTISYTIVPEDKELVDSKYGKNISEGDLLTELEKLNREYKKFKNPHIYVKFLDPIRITPEDNRGVKDFANSVIELLKKNIIPTSTYIFSKILLSTKDFRIDILNNLYSEKKEEYNLLHSFDEVLNIFENRGILKTENGKIKILENEIIEQYANRLSL